MSMQSPIELARIQRWMLAAISHPAGVAEGIRTTAAQAEFPLAAGQIADVIHPSRALSSEERLNIYAAAYHARLLDCLADEFPILVQTLGRELFDQFGLAYLQSYPPTSYSLSDLGNRLAHFLERTRPADEPGSSANWAPFIAELARLEWTFNEVFDGPGLEGEPPLDASAVCDAADLQRVVVRPAPSLRLLQFAFPVNRYYTAVRGGETPRIPAPQPTYVAVTRRDYVVRRHELSAVQHELLSAIMRGEPLGAAIERAASSVAESDDDFAAHLAQWFAVWAAESFFAALELPPSH